MKEIAKRYDSMDYMKGLMCIGVVLIHANFPDPLGWVVRTIARLAVPFFFFVSGFFLPGKDLRLYKKEILRKVCNIVKITAQVGIFYIVFTNLYLLISSGTADLKAYVLQKIDVGTIIKFFVTNDPFVYSALWFLLALIYSYLTFFIFARGQKAKSKWILAFVLLGFIGYLALTEWKTALHLRATVSLMETGRVLVLPNLYLFRSLPFLLLGILIRVEAYHINSWDEKRTKYICIIGIVIGSALAVVERFLFIDALYYMGTYLALICCCILAVRVPDLGMGRFWTKVGCRYSLSVYLYHSAVISVVNCFFNQVLHVYTSSNVLYAYTRPIIVVLLILALSWVVSTGRDVLKRFYCGISEKVVG